ncbi:MAG: DsbA family protein [Myxococcota bacterium]|nr:DsbA family protein [Myxococcota bacterium]
MSPTPWKILLLAGAVLVLGGATCQSATPDGASSSEGKPQSSLELAPDSGGGGPGPETSLGIPGMDFSQLTVDQRRQLSTVFSDEFCYCGCPHTLGQCLKQHTQCKHAKRMTSLAARHAAGGYPGSEIILILSRYYEGFREPRKSFKPDPRMCQGAENAPVTLVEFFDYECPYCASVSPVLKAFAKKYAAKVRFCALPYPLPNHPNGMPAAQAAMIARDAGKYWEMHDALFENQASLSAETLRQLASRLGLKGDEVGKAIAAGKYVDEVTSFRDQGRAAGVDSTPSLYLNGRRFQLDISEENLVHTVDDELEWSANKGAWSAD